MEATGTGKNKFSIYLDTQFCFEIINSDKIQVYKGLNLSPTRYQIMNIVRFHITY